MDRKRGSMVSVVYPTHLIANAFDKVLVGSDRCYGDELHEAGVSSAFVASIIEDGEEVWHWIKSTIKQLGECGELYCARCDEYFNYNHVSSDGKCLRCLRCNEKLFSDYCAACGYVGKEANKVLIDGYLYCDECASKIYKSLLNGGKHSL